MFFLEFSCFFYDQTDVGNLISGSSAFSKSSLNIWKFTVHVLLKPGLENFEHYFASMWDECNCVVVWAFFGIAFLRDWNEIWPFPALWPLLSFPNLLTYWVQHFHSIIFWDLKELNWNFITSITGCCFCFGSISSFFLELLLHWYPVSYWAPTKLGSSSFSVLSFCLFILIMGFSRQEIEMICHSLLQWTTFCQNSPPWPIHLGWPYIAWLIVSLS